MAAQVPSGVPMTAEVPSGVPMAAQVPSGAPMGNAQTVVCVTNPAVVNVAGPDGQKMHDTAGVMAQPLGFKGRGKNIAKGMTSPYHFQIVHNLPRKGCCYAPNLCCCIPELKSRGYLVIGENFVESNTPICCCCCTCDNITKVYFDRAPYHDGCGERCCGGSEYITEKDLTYCCFCIPCHCCYDICCRPCYGGTVYKTCCPRGSIFFLLNTRCCYWCIVPVFNFVEDSTIAKDLLIASIKEFRAKSAKKP